MSTIQKIMVAMMVAVALFAVCGSADAGFGYGYNNYGYTTRCRTVSRWDPYTRRYVRYRDC